MTSEVIIMNKKAAVIAADSAITVTKRSGKDHDVKYYKNANKIFEGSFSSTISVMLFDNIELNNVPWEIILKDFRDKKDRIFNDIDDYIQSLKNYIESSDTFINSQDQEADFHKLLFRSIKDITEEIKNKSKEIQVDRNLDVNNSNINAANIVNDNINKVKIIDELVFIKDDPRSQEFLKSLRGVSTSANKDFWEKFFQDNIPGVDIDFIFLLAFNNLLIKYIDYSTHTGIVVCGFGSDDLFPSICAMHIHGVFLGRLIINNKSIEKISKKKPSHIESFAMDDMANTFMYGLGQQTKYSIFENFISGLQNMQEKISEKHKDIEKNDEIIENCFSEFYDKLTKDCTDNHFEPLTQAIDSLAPEEMAGLAETLISLESLKERVTRPSESVGGPIDIAVLTKSDGFVWVQRKHYFPSELNMRYAERQRRKMQ